MNKSLFLLPIMSLVLLGLLSQTYAKDFEVVYYEGKYKVGTETLQDTNTVHELKSVYAGDHKVYSDKIKFYVLPSPDEANMDYGSMKEMEDKDKLALYKPKNGGPLFVKIKFLKGYAATH